MTEPADTPIYDLLVHEWANKGGDDARHRLDTDPVMSEEARSAHSDSGPVVDAAERG